MNTKSIGIDVLISADKIALRVSELGKEITRAYMGKPAPVVVCVLKGSFIFVADLIRSIDLPVTVDFFTVSSYGDGTESSGFVSVTRDLTESIEGKDVVIVEDIVDTGLTIKHSVELLQKRNPKSIKICSLLHKPSRERVKVGIDFLGFTIEDKFVIGYGLDHAQKYRNLPYIGVLSI
jgi:hypoxanthine phosphoribosyltransferase